MDTWWIIAAAMFGAATLALGMACFFQRRETQRLRAERNGAEEARRQAEAEAKRSTESLHAAERELAALQAASQAEMEAMRRQHDEQRAAEREEREKQQETMRLQFRDLANEILGEQSQHFRQTNRDALDGLLKPFRDNIVDFRKRVEEIYTVQTSQRGELRAELKNLMELNHRITTETTNLTNALKGNSKMQGDWGEMLLETILDGSSLPQGIAYRKQYTIKDEKGRCLRPDVVLLLPEKREIVIDSKVSLTAFVAYTAAEDAAERKQHLAAHVASVRQHVNELAGKEYQAQFHSPDFVILFIPNEPAFLEALKADPSIWEDAYQKKVILSSPTNLFALLKLVADLWKYHTQDKYTREIAACALKLYEQAAAFTTSLEGVGTALAKAHDAYEDAKKRLTSGNDNLVRVGLRLQKTAHLQSKRKFPAALTEAAEENQDPADLADPAGEPLPDPERER